MKSFVWSEEFLTGQPVIDAQHQRLVALINEYSDLMAQGTLNANQSEMLFAELKSYTQYHFREEEALMVKVGIDPRILDLQIKEHRFFVRELTEIVARCDPENPETASRTLEFLVYWLAYHILGSDQTMAKQLASVDDGMDAETAFDLHQKPIDASTGPLLAALTGLYKVVTARNEELLESNARLESEAAGYSRRLEQANKRLIALGLPPF